MYKYIKALILNKALAFVISPLMIAELILTELWKHGSFGSIKVQHDCTMIETHVSGQTVKVVINVQ